MSFDGQRAFAQKLNKKGAAEVRKQVSSGVFSVGSGFRKSTSNVSLASQMTWDVAPPPDFEEYLSHNEALIERDPYRHVLQFPFDDISVNIVSKPCRTVVPIGPEPNTVSNPFVNECSKSYTSDYTVVTNRYRGYSSSVHSQTDPDVLDQEEYEVDCNESVDQGGQRSSNLSETHRGSWSSTRLDLKSSQSDPRLPTLLDRINPKDLDIANEAQRKMNRQHCLFKLYPKLPDDEYVERRFLAEPPSENNTFRVLVKCQQLRLDIDIEPIFASMALFDVREKKKISENYYFDMNSEQNLRMISDHISHRDMSTLSRQCVLSITYPSPDVYLVIRLEKVLQAGDLNEAVEPYMKEDKLKEEKFRMNATEFCERLGQYRMPFAWTVVDLTSQLSKVQSSDAPMSYPETEMSRTSSLDRRRGFQTFASEKRRSRDDTVMQRRGSVDRERGRPGYEKHRSWSVCDPGFSLDNFQPVNIDIKSIFKQESDKLRDDDIFKILADMTRPSAIHKKLKTLPGSLSLRISPCPDDLPNIITPELHRVYPYPDDKGRPVKEVLEFPQHDVYQPYTTYRNLLYIYPKSLNFSNRQGSARNIACKVEFMSGSDIDRPLPVIFGKSSCPEFTSEAYTSVTYHSKTPYFYEEIKVKMPGELNTSHHILFTFYHISCQKKSEPGPVEMPIGYTWLPIFQSNRILSGEFLLPVSLEKPPPRYFELHPDATYHGVKWVDNHKGLFTVALHCESSVYPQDRHVNNFMYLCYRPLTDKHAQRNDSSSENVLRAAMVDLVSAEPGPLVRFLPIVLNRLIHLMVGIPIGGSQIANINQAAFETISKVIKRVQEVGDNSKVNNRNSLLVTYINYQSNLHPASYLHSVVTSPNLQSVGSYATIGRPTSLPMFSKIFQRSTSDPDIPGSNPGSPDYEVAMFGGNKVFERTGTLGRDTKGHQTSYMRGVKPVHEELVIQWLVSISPFHDSAMVNAWFFLELIVKSMAEHLARVEKLNMPRNKRFSNQFYDDLTELVSKIVNNVVDKHEQDPIIIQNLNSSLAFFLFDLFSLVDRGVVFQLIKLYCREVAAKIDATPAAIDTTNLIILRLDFLRIICSHEHFMALNLPFSASLSSAPSSPTPSISSCASQVSYTTTSTLTGKGIYTDLSFGFRQQHYLVGIVLNDLTMCLRTQNSTLIHKAVALVHNLLSCHDADQRYHSSDIKSRIAMLYLPLIGIVVECTPIMCNPAAESKNRATVARETFHDRISHDVAAQISGSNVSSPNQSSRFYDVPDVSESQSVRFTMTQDSSRRLLACFLWLVKNCDCSILQHWWSELSPTLITHILDILHLCVSNFEYKSKLIVPQFSEETLRKSVDAKSRILEAILGEGSARSEMMRRKQYGYSSAISGDKTPPQSVSDSGRLRWRKDQLWKSPEQLDHQPVKSTVEISVGGSLAAELSLTVLDTLELIIQVIQKNEQNQLLSQALSVLLHGLSLNQSTTVLQNMFCSQRCLVSKFPELLFEEDTEQCADLCLRLLRHCSSPIANTRSQACASLYLLMRHNFEMGNNFARVKMQVTMSLSSLVGQNQNFQEQYLRRALKTLLTYAECDDLQETSFPEQVQDMVFNLHMILSDTVKMKEFQDDPEMLMDLMYRIAKGYQNSPDLRLTWLQNMATKHVERENYAEAAHCVVHAAGLVSEYLNMLEDRYYMPVGCVEFSKISLNVLHESAVSDDVVTPDSEGVCTGKFFTESGLVGLLEQAASFFTQAGMYEAVNEVYKILIPIHEFTRDFKRLAHIHNKLSDAFNNIIRQDGKRMFGTYFRVAFYGPKFGDLDGEEFIYKEPAITKLSEISSRLEKLYGERYGYDCFVFIKDSNIVEREKLNPDKVYIQITYVEPYFDLYELPERTTYFEKNYNLKKFMFATPFTVDGRAHGELKDQYKRKTILTTRYSFPYIKTRLAVIKREQIILSPIEVAIEDIQKRTRELWKALTQNPPDTKILQMVLQGCIGTTVNQGPLEVALVFLQDVPRGQDTPMRHYNKLRLSFKDFLKKCSDALSKNKSLISSDMKEYQRELERNYQNIKRALEPLIWSTATQQGKQSRHHKKDQEDKLRRASISSSTEC